MQHFITGIYIEKLRHLTDIDVPLNSEKKQHLLITGKNGSGKTSLLLAMERYLTVINDGNFNTLNTYYRDWLNDAEKKLADAKSEQEKFEVQKRYEREKGRILQYKNGIEIKFNDSDELDSLYAKGDFITAFFPANRKTTLDRPNGVTDIKLQEFYGIKQSPGNVLLKYMVHLKTQQSYARNEGDIVVADKIQEWFDRFENALKILLDNDTISLVYDYKEYNFKILDVNTDYSRISVGLKHLKTNPKDELFNSIQIGDEVEGEVVKILPVGAVIRLDNGLSALAITKRLTVEGKATSISTLEKFTTPTLHQY